MHTSLPVNITEITVEDLQDQINHIIISEQDFLPDVTISPVQYTPARFVGNFFEFSSFEINVSLNTGCQLSHLLNQEVLLFFTNLANVVKEKICNTSISLTLTFNYYDGLYEAAHLKHHEIIPADSEEDDASYALNFIENFNYFKDKHSELKPFLIPSKDNTLTYKFYNSNVFSRTLLKLIDEAQKGRLVHNSLVGFLPEQMSKLPLSPKVYPFANKTFQKNILFAMMYSALEMENIYLNNNEILVTLSNKTSEFHPNPDEIIGHASFPLIDGEVQVYFNQDDNLLNLSLFDLFFNGGPFMSFMLNFLAENNVSKMNFVYPNAQLADLAKNNLRIEHLIEEKHIIPDFTFSSL